jgi:hypothetical protein
VWLGVKQLIAGEEVEKRQVLTRVAEAEAIGCTAKGE